MAIIATVVNVKGDVFAVNAAGVRSRLHEGDTLQEGEILVTGAGGSAELDMGGDRALAVPEQQTFAVDATVAGTNGPATVDSALSDSSAAVQQVIKALATASAEAMTGTDAARGMAATDEGGSSFAHLLHVAESAAAPAAAGADTVRWTPGDFGTAGSPNVDLITDFHSGTHKLVFKDLLTGAGNDPDSLAHYLHFEYNPAINSTMLNVSTSGHAADAAQVDQQIMLANYDVTAYGNTDAAIISNLLGNTLVIE